MIEGSDATDEINAEVDTALSGYDPPTKTELDARTLATADYFNYKTDDVNSNVLTIEGTDATTYIEGRTLAAANYFDPAADMVEDVNHVAYLDPNALNLINIAEPNAVIADWTYRDWSIWLFRRFSKGCSASASVLRTYKDGYDPNNLTDPNYILTFQEITSDGTTRLVGDVNEP